MKAILVGSESAPYIDLLRNTLKTTWELVVGDNSSSHLKDADALISIRFDGAWPSMPALKLLQAPATGLNAIRLEAVPPHVAVCNSYGHQIAIAEYNILSMLACAHQLVRIHSDFVKGHWYWSGVPVHPTHSEIYGKTLCLVGLGRIGLETARRAKAMGMQVIACNRTVDKSATDVDEVFALKDIRDCVSRADFVIVNLALTEETRGIVDAPVLKAMKPSAFIINVARGPLIEEAPLYHALKSRQIAGAVLDVWYRYPSPDDLHPAPADFPFQALDNVIVTPHVSGWTDGMIQRRWAEVASNLDRFAGGQPLINVVRPAQ